jgi:hypothetical protein
VNRLEITQVVIVYVHTDAEVEASVAAIDDFEVAELEIGGKTLVDWMWVGLKLITSTKFVCLASRTVTTA